MVACDLVKFYEGGLTFAQAKSTPFSEILELHKNAKTIGDKMKENN
jgi:hypothetical protein